jgi:solute carrier family 13 (sodium-dependent dicarboxylate transporter), member 2/3/5
MLRLLVDAVRRWDAATRLPKYRAAVVLGGLVLCAALLLAPTPEGLSLAGQRTAAVAVLMALWWVANALPMAVTALLPLVAFPLLGIATLKEAAVPFAHPLLFLMLGGFLLAAAMQTVGLHDRLTGWLLRPDWVRAHPRRVVLALMVAAAGLSGLVSNTATTVMMLPLAIGLGARCSDEPRTRSAFVLALAYAASIGGVSTLVGTPPNAVFAANAADLGVEVGFGQWMAVGLPFVVLALPMAWWVLTRVTFDLSTPDHWSLPAPPAQPWARGERGVLLVAGVALLAWVSRSPIPAGTLSLGGWGVGLGLSGSELDAMVALVAGMVVFLLPGEEPDGRPAHLLAWGRVEAAVPWSVLLLLGGGFSLASAIRDSGLTAWLATGAAELQGVPGPLTALAVALGMTFVTELTSNTASTQIALPLLAAAAPVAGVNPMAWMLPATLAASCAFMMPVATAPNAIASEAGGVAPSDMALAGLVLNLALAPVVAALAWWAAPGFS